MRVKWLRRAEKSLEAIADYIAQDNPRAAYEVIMAVRRAGEALGRHPRMGRPGRVEGTREMTVPGTPFLIPYRIKGDAVEILHVFHGARRWPEFF